MATYSAPVFKGVKVDYGYLIRVIPDDVNYFVAMLPQLHVKTLRVHSTLRGLWLGFLANEKHEARTVLHHMFIHDTTDYPVYEIDHKAELSMRLMDTMPEVECTYRFDRGFYVQCISRKSALYVRREFSHVMSQRNGIMEPADGSLQPTEFHETRHGDSSGA